MEMSMLKGLPKLPVRTDIICAGCQYDVFKDVLVSSHIQLSLHGAEGEANEDNVDEVVTQNSWQIGMYK
ncbi:hypothetical protein H5410_037533 [Solanum commersonii]|uniref:Uncharacterized protein n=1 Tax=Solanum commersonii TaxID=4109 RepID=A0A9J5Y841_SOLCO|nr:hypothetical protein H5410_037533 [Solanum commersonii]